MGNPGVGDAQFCEEAAGSARRERGAGYLRWLRRVVLVRETARPLDERRCERGILDRSTAAGATELLTPGGARSAALRGFSTRASPLGPDAFHTHPVLRDREQLASIAVLLADTGEPVFTLDVLTDRSDKRVLECAVAGGNNTSLLLQRLDR